VCVWVCVHRRLGGSRPAVRYDGGCEEDEQNNENCSLERTMSPPLAPPSAMPATGGRRQIWPDKGWGVRRKRRERRDGGCERWPTRPRSCAGAFDEQQTTHRW
jgi:hypothetical protein